MMRKRRFDANKERLDSQKSEIAPRSQETAALPPGELAILTAVVQTPGLDRQRLSVLVGYKKSSRDVYIQRLSKQGYVTVEGKQIYPTDDGRRALGDSYEPLPTGPALIEHWRQKLPVGEREIFDLLLAHGPSATVSRTTIHEATGKKKSSTDVYIQRLAARGLVATAGRGVVRLAPLT
jgi:DNA-binding MarR family transcriptional regulator